MTDGPVTGLTATATPFDAPVNAGCFARDGSAHAFGLGDGCVHVARGNQKATLKVHAGAVPVVKPYGLDGFITLSDDGTLKRIDADNSIHALADFNGAWTERMDVHVNRSIAVAVGRHVHLWTRPDADPKVIGPHNGTVTDVCFAPDGLGLAAAHRDGVTLWAWPHFEPQSMPLAWKGAHLAVTLSADKRWVVTAMQEGALHMWNIALKRDYQMRGYWSKPTRMAWSADRKWLATSGSESVILWPFDKGGPEGREALQLGWANGSLVSAVAAHPEMPVMAAGFEDGSVLLLDLVGKKTYNAAAPTGHAVTLIAFSPMGDSFMAGSAGKAGAFFTLA